MDVIQRIEDDPLMCEVTKWAAHYVRTVPKVRHTYVLRCLPILRLSFFCFFFDARIIDWH